MFGHPSGWRHPSLAGILIPNLAGGPLASLQSPSNRLHNLGTWHVKTVASGMEALEDRGNMSRVQLEIEASRVRRGTGSCTYHTWEGGKGGSRGDKQTLYKV